jgi:hypothetical protein
MLVQFLDFMGFLGLPPLRETILTPDELLRGMKLRAVVGSLDNGVRLSIFDTQPCDSGYVTQLLLYERNNGHAYFTELLCG